MCDGYLGIQSVVDSVQFRNHFDTALPYRKSITGGLAQFRGQFKILCRLIETGEILVWPWKFPKWVHMSEVRVGASSTMLDPTYKNCVGPLLLFVSVALWCGESWQIEMVFAFWEHSTVFLQKNGGGGVKRSGIDRKNWGECVRKDMKLLGL